jgi:Na+-driven multidrug efflux pump
MTDGHVVTVGRQLLAYLAVSGFFVTVALTYTGGLQGTGDTKGPFYISLTSQVIVPVGFCAVLQATRGLQASDIWLAIVIGHFTRGSMSVLRFSRGRWREIAVDIGPALASSTPPGTPVWAAISSAQTPPEAKDA